MITAFTIYLLFLLGGGGSCILVTYGRTINKVTLTASYMRILCWSTKANTALDFLWWFSLMIRLSYLVYTSYLDYFFVIWLIHTLSFECVDPLGCEKLLRLVNLDWYIAFSYIALIYCILDWYIVICHVINHHHVDLSWTALTINLLSLLGGWASLILVAGQHKIKVTITASCYMWYISFYHVAYGRV